MMCVLLQAARTALSATALQRHMHACHCPSATAPQSTPPCAPVFIKAAQGGELGGQRGALEGCGEGWLPVEQRPQAQVAPLVHRSACVVARHWQRGGGRWGPAVSEPRLPSTGAPTCASQRLWAAGHSGGQVGRKGRGEWGQRSKHEVS